MDISYKGIWSYHTLVVCLANTARPLYLVNRSGNRPSYDGAIEWIDRAINLTDKTFEDTLLRGGDTDFSLTKISGLACRYGAGQIGGRLWE